MKIKRLGIGVVTGILSALLLTGCAGTNVTDNLGNEISIVTSANAEDCLKLAEYTGRNLGQEITYTDEDIQTRAARNQRTANTERAVESLDEYIVVTYEGRLNGESFENGDGFFEGYLKDLTLFGEKNQELIGMKAGDTKTIEVDPEKEGDILAYKITLDGLYDVKEVTEQAVADAKEELFSELEGNKYTVYGTMAWNEFINECELIKMPKTIFNKYEQAYEDQCKESMAVTDISAYLEATGISEEDYETAKNDYAIWNTKNELAIKALSKELKISSDSKEYKEEYEKFVESMGMEESDLKQIYGEDKIETTIQYNLILKYIVDNGVFSKEESPTEATEVAK